MANKIVYMEAESRYAKVFEDNRDMGDKLPEGSDMKNKLEQTQGQYVVDLVVTPEAKAKAIADGIPDTGMIGQRWKTDPEGNDYYKASRKHFNPNMTDRETGQKGVTQGPPAVVKVEGDAVVPWDFEKDGYIGNGSKVVAKFSVWEGKIVDLVALKVVEQVEWEPEDDQGYGF